MYTSEDNEEEPDWVATERQQFSEFRDKNKDGKMDKEETLDWILPSDYDHAEAEAKHLLHESDANQVRRMCFYLGTTAPSVAVYLTYTYFCVLFRMGNSRKKKSSTNLTCLLEVRRQTLARLCYDTTSSRCSATFCSCFWRIMYFVNPQRTDVFKNLCLHVDFSGPLHLLHINSLKTETLRLCHSWFHLRRKIHLSFPDIVSKLSKIFPENEVFTSSGQSVKGTVVFMTRLLSPNPPSWVRNHEVIWR